MYASRPSTTIGCPRTVVGGLALRCRSVDEVALIASIELTQAPLWPPWWTQPHALQVVQANIREVERAPVVEIDGPTNVPMWPLVGNAGEAELVGIEDQQRAAFEGPVDSAEISWGPSGLLGPAGLGPAMVVNEP